MGPCHEAALQSTTSFNLADTASLRPARNTGSEAAPVFAVEETPRTATEAATPATPSTSSTSPVTAVTAAAEQLRLLRQRLSPGGGDGSDGVAELTAWLPGPASPQRLVGLDRPHPAAAAFLTHHWEEAVQTLLGRVRLDWPRAEQRPALRELLQRGPADGTLRTLLEAVDELEPCHRRDEALHWLQDLLDSDAVPLQLSWLSLAGREEGEERVTEVCRLPTALPDRLANRLQLQTPSELGRAAVSGRIGRYAVWTLWLVRDALAHEYEASVQPAGTTVGPGGTGRPS